MRTDAEINARIEAVQARDIFGVQTADLLCGLSWEAAQAHLSDEGQKVGPIKWATDHWKYALDQIRAVVQEALPGMLTAANNHDAQMAAANVDHLRAFIWLLGDEEFDSVDWDDFPMYGVPILKAVAHLVQVPWLVSVGLERMALGRPCQTDDPCRLGCGI